MKTISLGFEAPDYGSPVMAMGESEENERMMYPCLTIRGNRSLAKAMKPGEKFTATVEFCVTGVDLKGDATIDLDAESISIPGMNIKEDDGEMDGSTAMKNYFGKKKMQSEEDDDD